MSDTEDLWLEFMSSNDLCGLCGQHGIVDTRGLMRSPAGVECGVKTFCICPNGRQLKAEHARISTAYGPSEAMKSIAAFEAADERGG